MRQLWNGLFKAPSDVSVEGTESRIVTQATRARYPRPVYGQAGWHALSPMPLEARILASYKPVQQRTTQAGALQRDYLLLNVHMQEVTG